MLLFVKDALHMEPIVEIAHLVQESPSLALLQFLLYLLGNVVKRGELVLTHDVQLTMGMRRPKLLIFIAYLQCKSAS